jgi:hypothetical protein
MSVTFGFYNSLAGDRTYDATQISQMFDGLIADGVYATVGDALAVTIGTGMSVSVGEGRAWFNHTWTKNDGDLILAIDAAEAVLNRIDTVVLEVNSDVASRANTIKIVKGNPSSTPVAATLINAGTQHQYPLATVYVGAAVTEIILANITNTIGTVACPFVTGVIDTINVDILLAQWDAEFNDWFASLENVLDENSAAHLLSLINALQTSKAEFKNGSATFISGTTEQVVTDTFITVNTQVIISPTQEKVGSWSVASSAGSFTITSDATETSNVTFDWGATKTGAALPPE